MSGLVSRLSEIYREHRLREKVLVVPSLAIGHQIADAVAHGGTPWVNLRTETIRTIADAVAGFATVNDGLTVLSRAQALAIIERVCDRVLDASSYFSALADRPGLHRAIQRSIDDLRHAGIAPADIRGHDFEDARKAADIAKILDAYEDEMRRGKYVDRFGVLRRATELAERRKDALWFVVDDVELTAAEEHFLKAIAGSWETLTAASERGGTTHFRKGVGEENEVRGALRSILGAGDTFDDAEIVYSVRDPYLPLIYEIAAEYEVPATFAEGIPSYYTRPGQAALAFLRWIGEGWHAAELRTFAGAHQRMQRLAAIGWGRDRYLPRMDALVGELEAKDEEYRNEKSIERARKAREWVADLLSVSGEVAEGDDIDVAAAARAAMRFVERFGVTRNEVDGMAKQGLLRLFDELAAIGSNKVERREVTRRLGDAVRELHVSASNPRPGFLHVAPVRAGGWAARSRLFVIGLDDGRHPGSGIQDPIVLDSEREAIGVPVIGDRPQRITEHFLRLLGRASAREVTLSWPSFSIRDRRERFPSPALVDLFRDGLKSAVRESFVDPQPLSSSEWWMLRRLVQGDHAIGDALRAAYPNLARGAEAESARASEEVTPWDGKISADPAILDPRLNGVTYSASQLENMAGCPYRYFLERILKVRPLEELKFEPDSWLQPNEFGTMLHDVLETTMNEVCDAGEKPSLAFLDRMHAIAEEALQEWREEIPPPSEAAFERRRQELLESCEVFLRIEGRDCGDLTPKHFELPFDDFKLPLGGGKSVTLRGRIDRVDHDEARNEWHVWDYKSGSKYQFERGGRLQCGTKIQHAIYARAVEHLLGGRVTKSGYFFPTQKGAGDRIARECTDAELKDALNLLFDTVRTGYFPHGKPDNCTWCDFQDICGTAERAFERAQRKPAPDAWRRLQEVP